MDIRFAERFDGITGSEIRKIFALLNDPEMISLAGGNPSPQSFPAKEVAEIAEEIISKNSAVALQYGNTPGINDFLELLKANDPDIKDYDGMLVLTGSSQGIDFASRTLLNPGDRILVESPTFLGALQTYMIAQADIETVELEEDGVDLNMLEDKVKKYSPKFFYIIPTFQNPSGRTTSLEKRKAVYDICSRHGVLVLEDDPYKALRYEGEDIRSIKSFDTEGFVIKLMSYSKTISPGIRVGAVTAHKDIIQKFNLCKQGADVHTSNLCQLIVYEYERRGLMKDHLDVIRSMYREHRDALMDAVASEFPESVKVLKPQGGLFAWCEMPEGTDSRDIFTKCVENKVAFVPGEPFYAKNGRKNTFRLNFSMPSVDDIYKAIGIMGRILRENI
ncbi:MAG: PLP-dependent aminotransferase family protein [Christensenellaceae bacterium]|nr:PLP-dependent aminotransferase family protein [Christensenellaceae bacterium]